MIGTKLKTLREAQGLSQDKLGHLADVTGDYISKIELGKAMNAGVMTLGKLAKALGVELKDLIDTESQSLSSGDSGQTKKCCSN